MPSSRLPQGAGTIYWNEEMVFSAVHVFSDLRIALFSRSVIGSDNFLGEILVPLRDVAIDFGDDQADDPVLQPKREERRFALARRTTRHATSGELILTLGWIRSELETLTLRNGLLERELDNLLEDLAKTLEEESVGRGEPRDLLRPLSAPSETGSYAASVAQSDAVTATSRTLRTLVRSRLGPGPRSVAADSAPSSPSMGGAASSVTGTSMSGVDGLLGLAESELGIDAALGARFSAPGRLEVGILEARNLHGALGKTVLGATLDAFCLAVLRTGVGAMGAQSHATRVVRNSVSPSWNETFVFEPAQLSDTLEVTLLDRRRGRSNRVLGTLRIPIANLGDTTPRYAWLPLCAPRPHRRKERRSEAASGEVRLRLRWRDDLTVGAGVSAMHVEVGFKGLGVLVMDSGLHDMQTRQPREVMHASATDIDVTLRRSAVHEALHVAVRVSALGPK